MKDAVNEETIDKTLDWLSRSAIPAAKARAERIYIEEYRKSLKAILEARSDAKTVAEREGYAYSHPEYKQHLEALRMAVEADELYRWRFAVAEAKIGVWRSETANRRAAERVM